jgi:phage-related protein
MREIKFYKTKSGSSPIEEFLDSLGPKQAKKVTWVLKLIEEFDVVPKQYFKKLSGTDDIWEVRVIESGEAFRLLGFWDGFKFIVLVHALKKKSQKLKRRDITLAEMRKKDYLERKRYE